MTTAKHLAGNTFGHNSPANGQTIQNIHSKRGPVFYPEPAGEDAIDPAEDATGDNEIDDKLRPEGVETLKKERIENRKLKAELKKLQEKIQGVDLEEFRRLQEEKAAREKEGITKEQLDLEQKREYQAVLSRKEAEHRQQMEATQQQLAKLTQKMEEDALTQAVTEAFVENGGRKDKNPRDYVKMLMPSIRDRLKIEDGQVIVVDRHGEPRVNPEKNFVDFSLADLMEECRKEAAAIFFEPKDNASGAGATGNGRRSASLMKTLEDLEKLSPAERINQARAMNLG